MNPNDDLFSQLELAKHALEKLPDAETHQRAHAAFLANASATPDGDMRHSDQDSVLSAGLSSIEGEKKMHARKLRRLRLIAAVLLGVMLAGGFWSVPPLRTLAQEVIDFFIPAQNNTRTSEIYIGGQPHEEAAQRPRGDLASVAAAAPFDVHVPTVLPEGYTLESVELTHGVVFMTLTCSKPWAISFSQRVYDEAEIVGQEVGASAVIETVDINGVEGKYVQGTWDYLLPDNFEELRQNPEAQGVEVTSVWNSNLPWSRLVWVADGITFDIMSAGGIMTEEARSYPCAPTREMFSEIARGLVPSSRPPR